MSRARSPASVMVRLMGSPGSSRKGVMQMKALKKIVICAGFARLLEATP